MYTFFWGSFGFAYVLYVSVCIIQRWFETCLSESDFCLKNVFVCFVLVFVKCGLLASIEKIGIFFISFQVHTSIGFLYWQR